MAPPSSNDHLLDILRDTTVAMVRRDGPDLTARQLSIFLTTYLQDRDHTVRGLAAELNVSKPAVTRALDRLESTGLIRRKVDLRDRRSVLVQQTAKGVALLGDLRGILAVCDTAPAAAPQQVPASTRKRG